MKDLTYGELMMMCKGQGTSKIYERHLEVIADLKRQIQELREKVELLENHQMVR